MRCFRPQTNKGASEAARGEEKRQAGHSQQVSGDVRAAVEAAAQQDSKYQLSRIMRPDDANIVGNVHGGIILKMIEEAGCIVGTRHCNAQSGDRCLAALVRVEKTEFLSPMFIGEVAHVTADITYTSQHSLEVQVEVIAEDILTGTKKLANKAALWYVPCSLQNVNKVMDVPPIKYASEVQEEQGRKRYEAQKLERRETKARTEMVLPPPPNPENPPKEKHTVGFSQSSLIHLVGPSDCTLLSYVHGGCVVTVTGRLTYVSERSMEIEVLVDASSLVEADQYRAVSAFFTFISLDKDNKPLKVPALEISGEEETRRFEEGKARYQQSKAKRNADRQPQK